MIYRTSKAEIEKHIMYKNGTKNFFETNGAY